MTLYPTGQHPIKASAQSPWWYGAGMNRATPTRYASAALYVTSRAGALFISKGCPLSPNCCGRSSSVSLARWPSLDQMVEKSDV